MDPSDADSEQRLLRDRRARLLRTLREPAARLARLVKAHAAHRSEPIRDRQQVNFDASEAHVLRRLAETRERTRVAEEREREAQLVEERERKARDLRSKEERLRAELGLDEPSAPAVEPAPERPTVKPSRPPSWPMLVRVFLAVASVALIVARWSGCW